MFDNSPYINLDVHLTDGKIKGLKITEYPGNPRTFAVARFENFGLFFDETAVPLFREMLNAAIKMASRLDSLRNDSSGIQKSEERLVPDSESKDDSDKQSGSALDIPF